MDKSRYHEVIDELACDACHNQYCFFKQLLESMHLDPRMLVQFKCIEKFKWELGTRYSRGVGWAEAGEVWATQGYAKAFAEVYNEEEYFKVIYRKALELAEHRHIAPDEIN